MTWTQDKPTDEGFYWYYVPNYGAIYIIMLMKIENELRVLFHASDTDFPLSQCDGLWGSKIEEPEKP
jgi:hypothetical protein